MDIPLEPVARTSNDGAVIDAFEAHHMDLLRFVASWCRTEAEAEDLVQDAFVKLPRTADRYDPARGSLDTWVLLVARSLALDTLRRRVLEARTMQATRPLDDADPDPGPDRVAETKDLVERARAAMAGLTDGQRAALELAYFGGKTSAEVAEMEGIPLGTAKTRIRSGLLRLREALQPDPRGDAV